MKLTEDNFWWCDEYTSLAITRPDKKLPNGYIDCLGEHEYESLKQQILENQEKAEKWDNLNQSIYKSKEDKSTACLGTLMDDLIEENEQLKFLFEKYHDFLPLGMYNEFVKVTKEEGE
jgi:hypothetical protein